MTILKLTSKAFFDELLLHLKVKQNLKTRLHRFLKLCTFVPRIHGFFKTLSLCT